MSEKITMDGQYTYRNGEPARVLCVDAPGQWPVRSMDAEGRVHYHGANGEQIDIHSPTLVPIEPFRRGEVVMVRMSRDTPWYVRVFHSHERQSCQVFDESNGDTEWWRECRRPNPGELEEQS